MATANSDAANASTSTEPRVCAACGESEADLPAKLRRCARCRTAMYCSKACQTRDWPEHKLSCSRSITKRAPLPHPMTQGYMSRLGPDTSKVYEQLIDCFRLRMEDDYTFGGHNHGVYGGHDALPDFLDFLQRAKATGELPTWWDEEDQRKCEHMAVHDNHFNIDYSVEKSDIQDHYKDSMMPMKLRMVAENIYGGGYGTGQRPMPADFQCRC